MIFSVFIALSTQDLLLILGTYYGLNAIGRTSLRWQGVHLGP